MIARLSPHIRYNGYEWVMSDVRSSLSRRLLMTMKKILKVIDLASAIRDYWDSSLKRHSNYPLVGSRRALAWTATARGRGVEEPSSEIRTEIMSRFC